MADQKSWITKRDEITQSVKKMTDKGMMYISTPSEIASIINEVPKGKLITTKIIADKLKKKYEVDFTCPLTTGIFTSIVANAADEEKNQGKSDITPYWRVVKQDGGLYEKYLGETHPQKELLVSEGFEIDESDPKGPGKVKNFEQNLIE